MTLDEKLSKLYLDLKNGDSSGIKVDEDELYHLAINKGFAKESKMKSYGNTHKAMLTELGKQFETYEDFKNRNNNFISQINNSIKIKGDVKNSQLDNESSFGGLEFQKIEKKYPNNAAKTNQNESTISKLFKLTNHQVIGGLIVGLLLLLITWLIKD